MFAGKRSNPSGINDFRVVLVAADRANALFDAQVSQFSVFGETKARGNGKRPGPAVHNNLVLRDLTATGSNQLWLTDITKHHTGQCKLYVCSQRCGLLHELITKPYDHLTITGLATDCCILSTVLSAVDANKYVTVVADACVGANQEAHQQALHLMGMPSTADNHCHHQRAHSAIKRVVHECQSS